MLLIGLGCWNQQVGVGTGAASTATALHQQPISWSRDFDATSGFGVVAREHSQCVTVSSVAIGNRNRSDNGKSRQ